MMKVGIALIAAGMLVAGAGVAAVPDKPAKSPADNPTCKGVGPVPTSIPGATTAIFKRVGARELRLHVIQPAGTAKGNRPAVILYFGGGWASGDPSKLLDQANAFAAHGYVAVLADYRVLCRDNVTPLAGSEDARAALTWVRSHAATYHIDTKRIVLSGGSAGGFLAASTAMLASPATRPAALVLFNPATDPGEVTSRFAVTKAQAAAISPATLPLANLPPTIILHGKADTTVPITEVDTFCRAAVAAGRRCQLIGYEGQNHSFFRSHDIDPKLGVSPADDTMAKALAFLATVPGMPPAR